jgi:ribonuclease P protein component
MPGRLLRKLDFEAVLQAPLRTRSAHFAIHHLNARPAPVAGARGKKLSTSDALVSAQPVDDSVAGHWLGTVVPKRHAARAVTRNLLKRQMRAAFARHAGLLPPGMWLLRLRTGFDRRSFVSAASPALKAQAAAELDHLLQAAHRPVAA